MVVFLRRLVLLAVALGMATALLVSGMAMLAPADPAAASAVLQRDQAGALQRGVARHGDESESPGSSSSGSSSVPVVVLVLGGIVLAAALPPAHRVHVYHYRPPGFWWQ
jgi:hypothetical protein